MQSIPCDRRTAMTLTTPAPERYTRFSCPNPHCPRFNRPGEGNIAHRSWTGTHKHIERLRCTTCDREFSEREGTLMACSKLPEDTVIQLPAFSANNPPVHDRERARKSSP